jgi:hypothetical protein
VYHAPGAGVADVTTGVLKSKDWAMADVEPSAATVNARIGKIFMSRPLQVPTRQSHRLRNKP